MSSRRLLMGGETPGVEQSGGEAPVQTRLPRPQASASAKLAVLPQAGRVVGSAADASPVFIVEDLLVARHLAAHPDHAQARQVWAHLAATRPPLVTIPAVLDAAATALARAAEPAFAAERARRWAASPALTVVTRAPPGGRRRWA